MTESQPGVKTRAMMEKENVNVREQENPQNPGTSTNLQPQPQPQLQDAQGQICEKIQQHRLRLVCPRFTQYSCNRHDQKQNPHEPERKQDNV